MRKNVLFIAFLALFGSTFGQIQEVNSTAPAKVVIVTGVRFSYPMVEKWIEVYTAENKDVQIIIESRGSRDPLEYDILAEVYEHPEAIKREREYLYLARYAVLPVANSASSFAHMYADEGLTLDQLKEIFFHTVFSSRKERPVASPFTVYTRMQKAGVPLVFAQHFGFEQKDIKGTGIAGADTHLLKALLRDSTGVSYLPLPLIYDAMTRKPLDGLTVIPSDINGNKKITDDEKFYHNADDALRHLEKLSEKKINTVPIGYLHLSVDRKHASTEAVRFLRWIKENGGRYLHQFGYLAPEEGRLRDESFNDFAAGRGQ